MNSTWVDDITKLHNRKLSICITTFSYIYALSIIIIIVWKRRGFSKSEINTMFPSMEKNLLLFCHSFIFPIASVIFAFGPTFNHYHSTTQPIFYKISLLSLYIWLFCSVVPIFHLLISFVSPRYLKILIFISSWIQLMGIIVIFMEYFIISDSNSVYNNVTSIAIQSILLAILLISNVFLCYRISRFFSIDKLRISQELNDFHVLLSEEDQFLNGKNSKKN